MHHRAQLMVYERLLGIVPHLTRRRAASAAAAAGYARDGWRRALSVDRLSAPGGRVHCFDQLDTATAIGAVADRRPSGLDRLHEVPDDPLMRARVRDLRRRRAGVGVARPRRNHARPARPQVGADDAVVLDHNRAFRTGHFDPPAESRKDRRRRLHRAERAARELERRHRRVFDLDPMHAGSPSARRRAPRARTARAADRRCGSPGSSSRRRRPARTCRASASRCQYPAARYHFTRPEASTGVPSRPCVDERLGRVDVRLQAILKEDAELHAGLRRPPRAARRPRAVVTSIGFSISTCRPRRAAAMPCSACSAGRAADDHHVQRP